MFDLRDLEITGCKEITPRIWCDHRGRFVKIFHRDEFAARGLATEFLEEVYSISSRGVLRGLHFQGPPQSQAKLVYCLEGVVLDAVVDLRVGSPTYGMNATCELSADRANGLYVPEGMAQGFLTTSERALVCYRSTSAYAPECEGALLWSSAGIAWPTDDPILSEKDRRATPLPDLRSPFGWTP